ncbi:MAG: hypothetical protein K2M14_04825 [Muribaculaceae bacterium]|nr:hypothetical protein [Bacteroidales bacterium]MDE6243319.1 hypothetical protein [Muribaculaceae bacterium]
MSDFTQLFKQTIDEGKRYVMLQVDIAKLTAAEKLTLLISGITMGLIAVLCICFIMLLLAFAAADLFKEIMCPALAYTATAGSVLVVLLLIYFLRKHLIINPISRLLTKLFINPQTPTGHDS